MSLKPKVKYNISGKKNEKICITKYLAYSSNLDMEKEKLYDFLAGVLKEAQDKTFDTLFEEQKAYMGSCVHFYFEFYMLCRRIFCT